MTYSADSPSMDQDEFRDTIADLGWTQEQAAQKLGVTRRTAVRYANGEPIPQSKATLLRLLARITRQKRPKTA